MLFYGARAKGAAVGNTEEQLLRQRFAPKHERTNPCECYVLVHPACWTWSSPGLKWASFCPTTGRVVRLSRKALGVEFCRGIKLLTAPARAAPFSDLGRHWKWRPSLRHPD